jgi:hypothetical protein
MDYRAAHCHAGELDQIERNARKWWKMFAKGVESVTLPIYKERHEAVAHEIEGGGAKLAAAEQLQGKQPLPPGYINGRSGHAAAPPATTRRPPGRHWPTGIKPRSPLAGSGPARISYSQSAEAARNVPEVKPVYAADAPR